MKLIRALALLWVLVAASCTMEPVAAHDMEPAGCKILATDLFRVTELRDAGALVAAQHEAANRGILACRQKLGSECVYYDREDVALVHRLIDAIYAPDMARATPKDVGVAVYRNCLERAPGSAQVPVQG